MLRLVSSLLLLLGSSLFPAKAHVLADLSGEPSGAISFMSMTPRGPTELMEGRGTATAIAGALHVPSSTTAPGPAMVIMQAPIVFPLDREDDFTPAEHCRRYAALFESHGSPVNFQVYPGAHHGFDLPTDLRYLPRAQTARKCGLHIELEPRVVARRRDDGSSIPPPGIPSYLRTRMERGASYEGNAAALAAAIETVRSSVTHHLLTRN